MPHGSVSGGRRTRWKSWRLGRRTPEAADGAPALIPLIPPRTILQLHRALPRTAQRPHGSKPGRLPKIPHRWSAGPASTDGLKSKPKKMSEWPHRRNTAPPMGPDWICRKSRPGILFVSLCLWSGDPLIPSGLGRPRSGRRMTASIAGWGAQAVPPRQAPLRQTGNRPSPWSGGG